MKNIVDRKINVALVGCGRISSNHIKSILMNYNDLKLCAICDSDGVKIINTLELIKTYTQSNNLFLEYPSEFTDFSILINSIEKQILSIDLIILTTPSGLHADQCVAAANLGIHVCSEKPMATNWSDGLRMLNACNKNLVRLFVVKQNRFNSTLQLLKNQIEEGRFGNINLVSINVFWQRPQSYYDQDSWRGTWKYDGGALMNQASHYVDLLDWLIGPVSKISAMTATRGRDIEVEDTATIQVEWSSGTLGTMSVTMLTYPKNLEGSITILGDTGTVRIGGKAVNEIEIWEFSNSSADDDLIRDYSYQTSSVYGFGHPPYYANLISCLRGISEPMCDGNEGLKSLEILTAAYRSAEEEKIISLPLPHII